MKHFLLALCAAAALAAPAPAASAENYSYWIEPCSQQLGRQSGCEAADPELAEWAFEAWQRASGGALTFTRAAEERKARLRIYWAAGNAGLYGETAPIRVDGKRGAAVYVLPDVSQLGPQIAAACRNDRLFRHAIVYLTCLHESGHAIGLSHTAAYDDIMYFFGFGGDIVEYFARYRRKLHARADIRRNPGLSPADERRLGALYSK